MANASRKGMGDKTGSQFVGDTSPEAFDQDDMASDIQGRNSLQGNDQTRTHNARGGRRLQARDGRRRRELREDGPEEARRPLTGVPRPATRPPGPSQAPGGLPQISSRRCARPQLYL